MKQALPIQARLLDLWESPAMDDRYGECISIRDHMLQCAELARAQKMAPPLIAAALLHDIGWAMPGLLPHEEVAADWLELLFGPEVSEPVRWHVAAKRYLVAKNHDYLKLLSEESIRTLFSQGGPMNPAECSQFERNDYFKAAIALRHVDDAAKELRAPATSIGDYRELLKTLSAKLASY